MFAFAGLYEVWRDPEAEPDAAPIVSCTVLTREANEAMSAVHDRMPVMLAPNCWDAWLDRTNEDPDELLESIPPVPDELLTIYPVSTAVNNSRSRGAQLLDEAEPMTEHPAVVGAGDP
jgi:putative SOS response-associated peptidase YedK